MDCLVSLRAERECTGKSEHAGVLVGLFFSMSSAVVRSGGTYQGLLMIPVW